MGVNQELYGDDIQEFPHIYRGVVEDNNDPVKAGRVRARILGIHSDNINYVPTDTLPWAIPATSIGLAGGGLRNIGSHKVPDIGSHVFCFFEAGDHNFPVYFAGAPAIEMVTDYQEKDGKLKESKYEYDEAKRYDDASNYSDKKEFYETAQDEDLKPDEQVQDWPSQTRKDTFNELEKLPEDPLDPPGYKKTEPQPLFPLNFFQKDIRIAFDGKANHDTTSYDGIIQTRPSNKLTSLEMSEELDLWNERKWGYNDDDNKHQHDFKGGKDWIPEYPMCSTERNAQGEIIDTDILKERKTYIHPSKYFIEHIQLDATRKKDDFQNERSIKNVYERQRGLGNSPSTPSNPEKVTFTGQSNLPDPVRAVGIKWPGRGNNNLTYDDIDGKPRQQKHERFEERKHNPGREKTVIEDFVYRFYMNKVNETYQVDRNIRFYRGNDNLEIEHGDVNERLHRGSHNMHLDEGNYNRTVNKGWYHLHIDQGHHFVELGGTNPFEVSEAYEADGNPDNCKNQHKTTLMPNGADWEGCDAKFAAWPYTEGENECANQFFLLHKGHQIFRLEKGHQHVQINSGHQKFWLLNGHQTFHLVKGDQRFQLDSGNMERYVNGYRLTLYTAKCKETTLAHWQFTAADWWKAKAPVIVLDGDVRITGQVQIDGNVKCGVIDSPGSPTMVVAGCDVANKLGVAVVPSGTAAVAYYEDPEVITPGVCNSPSTPVVR